MNRELVYRFARGAIALVCCTLFVISNVQAADYPNHPVRIIVGYPPGGSTDILARVFGQYLGEKLGQNFIVDATPTVIKNDDEGVHAADHLVGRVVRRAGAQTSIRSCSSA